MEHSDAIAGPNSDLERKKLELEVRDLSHSWFQKPAYLAILLPGVVGLATILTAWKAGYLGLQLERQRVEAANLQFQLTRISTEVSDLKTERRQLEAQREELFKQIGTARTEDNRLAAQIRQRETALKSIQRDLAMEELTSILERLVRGC